MTLEQLIEGFNTTPFLFVGSGITRRYYGLPDWKGLLTVFARKVQNDDFAYAMYETEAKTGDMPAGVLPKIAELIETDYNRKWFKNEIERTLSEELLEQVRNGLSPFKAEVASFITRKSSIAAEYQDEISKFALATEKSVSGIITTNYDGFLEDTTDGYKVYVGQEELIFSPIQGISEIYKIHGSVSQPDSIILNAADYIDFRAKSAYLAAKLMTIFMEYPIIFLGYSLGDYNVQEVLSSIVSCLSTDNLQRLQNRFIFVDYIPNSNGYVLSPHTFSFGEGKMLAMTKIELGNFGLLYDALLGKKATLPVKLLRLFKQEFYDFTITNIPTARLKVAELNDARIADDDIVVAVGTINDFAEKGYTGITANDWYRNIILNDLPLSADKLLEYVYPNLKRGNPNLPVYKYLANSTQNFSQVEEDAKDKTYESFIPYSVRKQGKSYNFANRSIQGVIDEKPSDRDRNYLIKVVYLSEDEIDVAELEQLLLGIIKERPTILDPADNYFSPSEKTNLRRLIRVYDFLKYKKRAPAK